VTPGVTGRRIVSLAVVRAIVHAAQTAGIEAAELLAGVGLTEDALSPPDDFVAAEVEERLWSVACHRARSPAFGLTAALTQRRGAFRALEYLCRTSPNLRAALESLLRFQRVLHGTELYSLRKTAHGVTLEYHSPHPASFRFRSVAADFALATLVVIGRDATGTNWAPKCVRLRRSPPEQDEPYERVFMAPVQFKARTSELEIDAETLATPMREADPVLCSIMEGCVLRALPPSAGVGSPLSERVREVVAASLAHGDVAVDRIARTLGMGRRRLQNQLAAAGTTYQHILEETRLSLAREYLARPDLSVPEIALLLGYSDVTAFHRAFRRWTGQTPGACRRRLGSGLQSQWADQPRLRSRAQGPK